MDTVECYRCKQVIAENIPFVEVNINLSDDSQEDIYMVYCLSCAEVEFDLPIEWWEQ